LEARNILKKISDYICAIKLSFYLCSPKKYEYEQENISAVAKEKKEQTWFQGKNVNRQWPESSCCTQGQRQKETDCFRRRKAQSLTISAQADQKYKRR